MNKKNDTELSFYIAENTVADGTIEARGSVRIDGKFTGNIKTGGHLIIGENAIVKSENIQADEVTISGNVTGDIDAPNRVFLKSTAKYIGNLKTRSLIIEEGAFFKGQSEQEEPKDKK